MRPRRLPFGTIVYALALLVMAAGLVVMAFGPWRLGVSLCGGAFAGAAVARIAIPERSAGLLRVRRRVIDVLWMGALAGLIITLAIVIPSQPSP
ncbi:DUF3017 domain-containing protein [Nocardioidaceae bacterium SCSIO 66511]|nr:DUF3017 domain-containing protein [Nocardioidaceae bacterium SCSIO 66511]